MTTIGCPTCGTLDHIPPIDAHALARCRRCHATLERRRGRSVEAALACTTATFVLLFPANLAPLMTVTMLGASHSSVLASGIVSMWNDGWVILAVLLGMFGIVLPFARFGGLMLVLAAIGFGWRFSGIGAVFRWSLALDAWAMPDVYLVGCIIGYVRVTHGLTGSIGAGGYCLIAAGLMSMLTRASLDRRTVWRAIEADRHPSRGEAVLSCAGCDMVQPYACAGRSCSRCGLTLRARRVAALSRASALSLAALVLTVPANLLPMTTSIQLGRVHTHRIVDGVMQLFHVGLWPFGILTFITSIVIPVAKIVGMGWFVASVLRRSRRHLRLKVRLYRWIDELGRWSNVDVFTIAAFVPLIRFDGVASAQPATGATAFALVVFLTMLASRAFDPRLMWDRPDRRTR
ncbi:paraquat-inducible protein A [Burkholderia vietnamiensis]|uniref:paraquat-inducible protein A n=1 Tax=Burkholderia vietnamiensis TaxID=60552 RepID=UPI00075DD423|nr:paraquat-inducible protein A [Burkholderia vietnamiensis]KVF02356.1 paraquat-inducible protein A [Burkholderia vietnamiensis]MBR8033769.1 paraquat-inducible protein A [Burkholderia vietnamiensis]